MANKRCICIIATDGQWLLVQILFWAAVTVIAVWFFMVIVFIIQDCIENRHRPRRRYGRDLRSTREEELRFEEIRK